MDKYTQAIIDEINWSIREQKNYGAFEFPLDEPDEGGAVTHIYSTYDEDRGAVYIFRNLAFEGKRKFCCFNTK